jgi:hypothetical protein
MSIRYQSNQKRKSYRPKLEIKTDGITRNDDFIPFSSIKTIYKDSQTNPFIVWIAVTFFTAGGLGYLFLGGRDRELTVFLVGVFFVAIMLWQGRWTALYVISDEAKAFTGNRAYVLLVTKDDDEILDLGEKIRLASKEAGYKFDFKVNME